MPPTTAVGPPSFQAQDKASPPFCEHAKPQENCFVCWRHKKGLWARPTRRQGVDTGSPKGASNRPGESQTSDTVSRRSPVQVKSGRARRPGRPRVPAPVPRQKARERDRRYRGRQRRMSEPTIEISNSS